MNPKHLTKTVGLLAATVGLAAPTRAQPAPTKNPNIVIFLVDDMGWQDTSLPFWKEKTPLNQRFRTPSMERLAAQGETFTNAYACPICTPSRVSLMTGWNAARHRVTNWTFQRDQQTDPQRPTLDSAPWNVNGLSNSPDTPRATFAPTLPEELRAAGYRTIHVGKAHWGAMGTPGADPTNLGFDVNIGGSATGQPGSYFGQKNYSDGGTHDVPGLDKYHGTNTFLSEALTLEANAQVNETIAEKKPFYLYMAHYAVHTPIQKDDRFYQKYIDTGLSETESKYATLVEGMDKSLGDVMDNLEKQGVADNTVIIFMSDNGGLGAYDRTPPLNMQNLPLRSGKGSMYEGGIRVPMIVKWPGLTTAKTRSDVPVIIDDFLPTILGNTKGSEVPPNDGINLKTWLQNPTAAAPDRALLWHYPNSWGGSADRQFNFYTAMRRGDWKLNFNYADRKFELYNLRDDIGEHNDLAAKQPEKVKELAAEMRRLLIARKAQMPLDKATGAPVALPGL